MGEGMATLEVEMHYKQSSVGATTGLYSKSQKVSSILPSVVSSPGRSHRADGHIVHQRYVSLYQGYKKAKINNNKQKLLIVSGLKDLVNKFLLKFHFVIYINYLSERAIQP